MKRSSAWIACAAAAALVSLAVLGPANAEGEAKSPELAGTWKLAGWNVGTPRAGKPDYTGSVALEAKGKGTFLVSWTVNNKVVNTGVGLWDDRTRAFASGYSISGKAGVAIFRLSEDHKTLDCVGTFQGKIGEVAYEEWKRD